MKKLIAVLDFLLTRVLVLLMIALVASVLWQVFSRYVLSTPSSWTEEMARFLLIWISLLGAAYAFRNGMHLALDLLSTKMTGKNEERLRTLTLFLVALFSLAVLVIGGFGLVQLTWELKQYSAVLGLPMSYVYSVIPVTGVLICLYAAAALRDETIGRPQDAVSEGD